MALNLDVIRAKLAASQNKGKEPSKTKEFIWRPTKGTQVIRILPYQHQPGNPFIELFFDYGLHGPKGKYYLSPVTFGRPDPVVLLTERLKANGGDDWKRGRKLEKVVGPKKRTYVPMLLRSKEEAMGMKFWGFGKEVADQLMEAMLMEDFGDLTDLNAGYDIQVTFTPAEKEGEFPKTSVIVKPKPRPVVDPALANLKEFMDKVTTKQPNIIKDVFTEATFEEISTALEEYIKKSESAGDDNDPTADDPNVVLPSEEQQEAAAAAVQVVEIKTEDKKAEAPVVSPTAEKAEQNAVKPASLAESFANVFDTEQP